MNIACLTAIFRKDQRLDALSIFLNGILSGFHMNFSVSPIELIFPIRNFYIIKDFRNFVLS